MAWRNVWNLQLCQAAIPPSTAASRQMGLTPTDRPTTRMGVLHGGRCILLTVYHLEVDGRFSVSCLPSC